MTTTRLIADEEQGMMGPYIDMDMGVKVGMGVL